MLEEKMLPSKPFNKTEILNTPEEVASRTFDVWKELANSAKDEFYVAAPLSSTPLPLYQMLIERSDEIEDWTKLRFVFMDEMLEADIHKYVERTDQASYISFAINNLLGPIANKYELDLEKMIVLPDIDDFSSFEEELNARGGLDLLILATGAGGHFAQVVPGTPLRTGFHISDLTQIPGYAEKHTQGGAYEGATFRDKGMSLGYDQVLAAKNIVLMLTGAGADKKEAASELFSPTRTEFTEEFPISILYHPEVSPKTSVFVSKEVLAA